jgi:hypothetical protein
MPGLPKSTPPSADTDRGTARQPPLRLYSCLIKTQFEGASPCLLPQLLTLSRTTPAFLAS